jgi:pimeloyl-ACP methyl ester carboxylesterase
MAADAASLAVYGGSQAMADPTLLGRFSGVSVPTLVLWGESDRMLSPLRPGLCRGHSRSTVRGAVGHGHVPQMETPELVIQAI